MVKRMLIDATHAEETRVVVVNGTRLEQLDVETSTKKQLKGNIYLAKVIRVEPSLQAAFVDYGGNRHGFLAFSEIHPDYYQIPQADRQALMAAQAAEAERDDDDEEDDVESLGGEDDDAPRSRSRSLRDYKIQEVIKRRQIMLVQVVKEERGNKGAALTTYLSLAGRYCVLMPNTARGGGVSRKITSLADRKRLKQIMAELAVPNSMAVILRTAGQERSQAEIKRDYEYLMRTWNLIREHTMAARAPALIHEEGSLIKRAIRDVYSSDIEEVLVDGENGYRQAKDFMKLLTPSHAKRVQPYRDETMPLYHRFQVDSQLDAMHSPTVHLKSGGYLVINQTEALVAIDVNSGRATKERHIEETAVKTNLEAAEEISRQLRLRDLAGLIVIDFIDMEESRNNAAVERKLKDSLKQDRARIQMGRISHFGLLELSRQRLRPSLQETSFEVCPHCKGSGVVRSVESAAVHILRVIEEEGVRRRSSEVVVAVATPVALYILNHKRAALSDIESRYDFSVYLRGDDELISPDYRMERVKAESAPTREDRAADETPVQAVVSASALLEPEDGDVEDAADATTAQDGTDDDGQDGGNGDSRKRRKRRKRRRRSDDADGLNAQGDDAQDGAEDGEGSDDSAEDAEAEGDDVDGEQDAGDDGRDGRRRRRSRRGGRRRRRGPGDDAQDAIDGAEGDSEAALAPEDAPVSAEAAEEPAAETEAEAEAEASATEETTDDSLSSSRPRRRRVRRSAGTRDGVTAPVVVIDAAEPVAPVAEAVPEVVTAAPVIVEPVAPVAVEAPTAAPVAVEPVAVAEAKPVEIVGAAPVAEQKPRRGWWSR